MIIVLNCESLQTSTNRLKSYKKKIFLKEKEALHRPVPAARSFCNFALRSRARRRLLSSNFPFLVSPISCFTRESDTGSVFFFRFSTCFGRLKYQFKYCCVSWQLTSHQLRALNCFLTFFIWVLFALKRKCDGLVLS